MMLTFSYEDVIMEAMSSDMICLLLLTAAHRSMIDEHRRQDTNA